MSNKIVVFDIGHGINTYPPSKGIKLPDGSIFAEHDFNSKVGIKAIELAKHNGFEVVLTQEPFKNDNNLKRRKDIANKQNQALCLISLHANASSHADKKGYGVFHWHTSKKGKELAQIWLKHAKANLPSLPWGTGIWECKPNTWTNFYIIRETSMPAILLEHFFFTNLDELKVFNTKEIINKCAEVTVKTLCEFAGITYKTLEDNSMNKGDIEILLENGIIKSPDYWAKNAVDGGNVAGEYARVLINNMANYINSNKKS